MKRDIAFALLISFTLQSLSLFPQAIKNGNIKITVQVLNEETNRPVTRANVSLRNKMNKSYSPSNKTSTKGEFVFTINKNELGAFARVIVKATDYDEKWSDITSDLLQGNERLVTVYLKGKEETVSKEGKKYGPFEVTASGWVSTGLKFKEGGSFTIEATGLYRSASDSTFTVGPNGGGHWGWYTLQGKVGELLMPLGKSGGATVNKEGYLNLGTPRVRNFFPEDGKDLRGSLTVFVYAKGAVPDGRLNDAHELYELFRKIYYGEKIGTDPQYISDQLKREIARYNLVNVTKFYNLEDCLINIEAYYNELKFGKSVPEKIKLYQGCITSMMNELRIYIEHYILPD